MSKPEFPAAFESSETASLEERIKQLRIASVRDVAHANEFTDAMYLFDVDLQRQLTEHFGDAHCRKFVSEWHLLSGSSPETHDLDPEAKQLILEAISDFVSEMEEKWSL